MSTPHTEVFHRDPLHDLRADGSGIADLAFGSLSRSPDALAGRHLAFLPVESLALDLSDPAQRQFGDYELLELIGEGGMGVVYRARQRSLDREVAVKLLAAGLWASKDFIERFRLEAQNAARMQHPNIVTIYEVGSAEELQFFSMRLIRGESLAAVIRREGRLAPSRAASLLRTIAEAVDYAHRLGVLHLDLKPANVLIDENGAPHVADFGLARRLEQELADNSDEVSGTPSYMAPEQARAGVQKITPATDIWGLGAILYELLTAQPPFLGDSAQATLHQVVHGELHSPRSYVPDLPRDLEAIILKCMSREVSTRYPSARALADDLGRFLEHRPVQARRLNGAQRVWRWARRQPYVAALGSLFTISMLAGIIGVATQWKRAETNARHAIANAAISSERLWEGRREAAMRLETDGKGFEALPALIANIEEQEKTGKSSAKSIERYEIGMILSQGVTLIDRMILPDAHPLAAELSTDGTILAIALADQTVRWFDTKTLAERGRVDLSALPTSNGGEIAPRLLRFIDDKHLLVTLDWEDFLISPTNHDTYLIDLEHARVITPPAQFPDLADAVYSANGRYAMLFDQQDGRQLWQVEPWRALSVKTIDEQRSQEGWLLGRDGSFALSTTGSDRINLELYDLRNPSPPEPISFPGSAQPTAWTENGNGSLVALGDSKGHVYVLDPHSGRLRSLPTPLGTQVNWLAFSEDDAWLAAVRKDGAAFAFDVASGDPLNAGQMQQDFDARQVAISHRERLLVASGGFGETALWRLPQPGPTGLEATRLISRPTQSAHALTNSVGTSLQTGLLATADLSGEVRLWRLPRASILPILGAPAQVSIAGSLYFDGKHLPDVAWNKVRVASTNGTAATPWITLPQPLGYAELLDGGKTLLTTSGPAMYVFDAATMQLRYPAVPLPANPIRMVASADGSLVVFAFGGNGVAGFEERLQAYDPRTGKIRPGNATVNGPLREFELSPDAKRLLTSGPPHGSTEVFDAATLNRQGSYPHDPERPVVWASFTPQSGRVWLLTRGLDINTVDDADLISWDPVSNAVREKRTIPDIAVVGLTAATGRPILAAHAHDLVDPTTAITRSGARTTSEESSTVFAITHDGRLLAHALGRDVQLHDATTLAAVGPPLHSNFGALEMPGELAFSVDDTQLLARGQANKAALIWAVAADTRPLAEIRRDAELLNPDAREQRVLQIPNPEQSSRLRRRDPGALPASEARPLPPVARMIDGIPVPARDPTAGPMLLDLTQAYTVAPETLRDLLVSVLPVEFDLPWGVARLDRVDYDVRGIVELREHPGRTMAGDTQSHASGIRVPAVPIAAFHALIVAAEDSPEQFERDYASIRLHYVDGSTALLPIRTQRDVPGYTDNDKPVPVAFAFGDYTRLLGIMKQTLIDNPRLPNPHPERLIASLDLEAAPKGFSEPVFLAITAEPVIGAARSGTKPENGGVK